ncbi:copper resistance protein B [Halothiobacillus sp.]|uniref:copper resistance protein B n=1 Tax=Halothiobacillus sp. TaxID=1891311 RepID=UPI002AD21D41|nr:copper resistance protein B [Halothiobacillus sp.]
MNKHISFRTQAAVFAMAFSAPLWAATAHADTAYATSDSGTYQAPSLAQQRTAVATLAAESARHETHNPLIYKVMIDRLERDYTNKGNFTQFEGQAYIGTDTNKLWLKGEGKRLGGVTQDADIAAYYSHAIAAFWDAQIGARHDFSAGKTPGRNWLGLGVQGLAPYKFDTTATAYVGSAGRTALRLSSEYDFFITQRLIFWPGIELNMYGKNDPERDIGKGLSDSRVVLRLRYEIRREFAPYVGIQWTNKYGQTARYARANGEATSDMQLIAGLRLWW